MLEPTFLLQYYMGFSFTEAMNLPLGIRRWFIERIQRELSKTGPNGENPPNRTLEGNTAEARTMQGMHNPVAPARLRRFT